MQIIRTRPQPIIRGDKTIIPGGLDYILPHDKVIVIAAGKKLYDLSDVIE